MKMENRYMQITNENGISITIDVWDHCPSSIGLQDADEEDELCCDECLKCWKRALKAVEDFEIFWKQNGELTMHPDRNVRTKSTVK